MSEDTNTPFSRRFGYRSADPEITIREDAPPWLRLEVAQIARELRMSPREVPMSPEEIRTIVCRKVRKDPSDWKNAWDEVVELLRECEWPKVYEVAEALYEALDTYGHRRATEYEKQLNYALHDGGVGWQMQSGRFVVRGSEPSETKP